MKNHENEFGQLTPEEASGNEVKAVLDTLDLLLHIEGIDPPEDYDSDIPLVPVDGMDAFSMRRHVGDVIIEGVETGGKRILKPVEVGRVSRSWSLSEERREVIHILKTPKGYQAKRIQSEDLFFSEDVQDTDYLSMQLELLKLNATVTSTDCKELLTQLSATRILK